MEIPDIRVSNFKLIVGKTEVSAALASASFSFVAYSIWRIVKTVLNNRKRRKLTKLIRESAIQKPFLVFSAVDLAEKIRNGELSAHEVVLAYVEQSKLVEPYINCITDECWDEALKEAKAVDNLLDSVRNTYPERLAKLAEEKPLLGVPFYSKECFEVPGFNFTCGLYHMKGNKGKKLSPVVWRTKQSGAILMGAGNLSEAAMWYESYNKVYGYSNNPYDPTRSVGGSSGGGCALVAALCAGFALTSDVGGSTRM